jgi:anti-sigma-K factor RskA
MALPQAEALIRRMTTGDARALAEVYDHYAGLVDDVARVKTFAVTLEPAAGTAAPTGPMILAGAAGS